VPPLGQVELIRIDSRNRLADRVREDELHRLDVALLGQFNRLGHDVLQVLGRRALDHRLAQAGHLPGERVARASFVARLELAVVVAASTPFADGEAAQHPHRACRVSVVMHRAPLAVFPAEHIDLVPRARMHQTADVAVVGEVYVVGHIANVNPRLLQPTQQFRQGRTRGEVIEIVQEVVKRVGVGHDFMDRLHRLGSEY
jgi:hypothetical protein